MLLKDKILDSFDRLKYASKKSENKDPMSMGMHGWVEVIGKKNGVVIYHDEGSNHVTYWARHAIMQMIRGRAVSNFGSLAANSSNADKYISKRGTTGRSNTANWDGTMVSSNSADQYWLNTDSLTGLATQTALLEGGNVNMFHLFPTKILMGTGVEFHAGTGVTAGNITLRARVGGIAPGDTVAGKMFSDQLGLTYTNNSGLITTTNNHFTAAAYTNGGTSVTVSTANLYSNIYKPASATDWTTANVLLTPARTFNDVYSTTLPDEPSLSGGNYLDQGATSRVISATSGNMFLNPTSNNQTTGVTGAVKSILLGTKTDFNSTFIDTTPDIATDSILKSGLRGFGQPAFVYFNMSENVLGNGETSTGTLPQFSSNKQTKITFVAKIAEQASLGASQGVNAYNPYNGYVLKEVGLFNDAIIPAWSTAGTTGIPSNVNAKLLGSNTAEVGADTITKHASSKMPYGTLWAHRKIKPIFKDKDVSIEIRWTIFFDETS